MMSFHRQGCLKHNTEYVVAEIIRYNLEWELDHASENSVIGCWDVESASCRM